MDKDKFKKILIGAMVALLGALITYAANVVVPFLEKEGGMTGPIVAALLAVAVNAARKLLEPSSDGGKQDA